MYGRRGASPARRNVACDDGRHWGVFRGALCLSGSYSTTGVTAKVSRRGGLTTGLMVNGHSPTQTMEPTRPMRTEGPAGEWQTIVFKVRVIIAQFGLTCTREVLRPARTITVGGYVGPRTN